jgi:hypothetical protein
MLLSKALRMQQDLEDKKHEVIIEGLESKMKDQAAALEKKDFDRCTFGPVGAPDTVRCPLPPVGAGHASPADCATDRWLTGQSGEL